MALSLSLSLSSQNRVFSVTFSLLWWSLYSYLVLYSLFPIIFEKYSTFIYNLDPAFVIFGDDNFSLMM